MADGCRFENRKIGISLNATFRQTDFDEIWLGDACWSPAPDVKFKFLIFRPSYMADSRYLENRKTT